MSLPGTSNQRASARGARALAILCSILLLCTLLYALITVRRDAALYDSVVRLHVLANSDSDEDQALKLQVRDAVLAATESLCADCQSRAEALSVMQQNEAALRECAAAVIAREGYDYGVTLRFGVEHYGTRTYGDFTLPAGQYESVRVVIGQGEGQNWWCVLFPPLCVESAAVRQELVESGFTQNQIRILTESDNPRYRLRFKAVEAYEGWRTQLGR